MSTFHNIKNGSQGLELSHSNKATRRFQIIIAAAFLAVMVLGVFASMAAAANAQLTSRDDEETMGYIMVAAIGADKTYSIEPTFVEYKASETAEEALAASDLGLEFTNHVLQKVKGEYSQGSSYIYEHSMGNGMLNNYDASEITSVVIADNAGVSTLSESHANLLSAIARYDSGSNGLHNYPDAQNARSAAQQGLPTADSSAADTLATNLYDAIDAYDNYINGQQFEVTFNVSKGGDPVEASIVLTDEYGNQTEAMGNTALVVAGTYSYKVVDETGLNGVVCTEFEVDDTTPQNPVKVSLPEGEWFGSIDLQVGQDNKSNCQIISGSATDRSITFAVPDATKSLTDLYVYAVAGNDIKSIANYNKQYKMYAVYKGQNKRDYSLQMNFESSSSVPQYLVGQNLDGNSAAFDIRHDLGGNTYQFQTCNVDIVRCPTLGSLSVIGDSQEHIAEFKTFESSYEIVTTSSSLKIKPTGFVAGGDYSYTVAGQAVSTDGTVDVEIPQSASSTPYDIPVVVSLANGTSKTYTLKVTKVEPSAVTFSHDASVSVEVFNQAGSAVVPTSVGSTSSSYGLIAGQTYTYVGTTKSFYHVRCEFEAQAGSKISVPTPKTSELVSSVSTSSKEDTTGSTPYPTTSEDGHNYVATISDRETICNVKFAPKDTQTGITVKGTFVSQKDGNTHESTAISKTSGTFSTPVAYFSGQGAFAEFIRKGGYSNVAEFEVVESTSASSSGSSSTEPEYYQTFTLTAKKDLSASKLNVTCDSASVTMIQTDTADDDKPNSNFDSNVVDYTVGVPKGTTSLNIGYGFTSPLSSTDVVQGGYIGTLDGVKSTYSTSGVAQTVELDPELDTQDITLLIEHEDTRSLAKTYTIHVNQLSNVTASFDKTPSDTNVGVIEDISGQRVEPNSDGTYTLVDSYSYTYTAACLGYKGVTGKFKATKDMQPIKVELEAATPNPDINTDIVAQWPNFRADANNNSVTNFEIPTSADDALLYWAVEFAKPGEEHDGSNSPGCPILVDGYLYTYAGDQIYKMDTVTGEVVAQATMVGISSWAITPMTYAQGMIFIALSDGRVQAFNAETLESLWVYHNAHGGQPNCPISYADGKIYTGFWNAPHEGKSSVGDLVCLTITDEDLTQTKEEKVALWEYPHSGGFYWAGSYATEDFVISGSDYDTSTALLEIDNEKDASGTLYSFDSKTGKILDTISEYPGGVKIGNIRSTPVYEPTSQKMYWVGRGGYFCSVTLKPDGTFDKSTLTCLRLENNNTSGAVSSTATPVIWNGRAYVGADAGSYSGAESGHCVDVIDLATNTIAYKVPMGGRPQSTAVATTAYVDDEGYAYLYFIDNMTPGKIRYFKDKPGQKSAITNTVETSATDSSGTKYNVADVLFCPAQKQQEYCICSPIADQYGNIYIKNDSTYMMAIGPTIEKVEITTPPDRTTYSIGETFDPTGMKVTATYSNGKTRDITNYVTYQTEAFEITGTQTLEVKFPYTMYQNSTTEGQVGTAPDYNFKCPSDTLTLTVEDEIIPQITTESLPDGLAATWAFSTPYSATLAATGLSEQCTWSMQGTLPKGLTFDASSGVISGTPATGTGGEYELKFSVTNSKGTGTKTLTLTINELPSLVAQTLPEATERTSYSAKLEASSAGYPAEITSWTLSSDSTLPAGLSLDASSGVISGTPEEAGSYVFYVNATNAAGISSKGKVSIKINEYMEAPAIITSELPDGLANSSYNVALQASGVPASFAWTVVGTLPKGLSFDASSGVLSGTPATGSGGMYELEFSVTNSVGTASKKFFLTINEVPTLTEQTLESGMERTSYSAKLEATSAGYPAGVTSWTLALGSTLPAGLSLDASSGVISGTPEKAGTYEFYVYATNAAGTSSRGSVQLTIVEYTEAPVITTAALPTGLAQQTYSATLSATGLTGEYAWTIDGALPQGLSFDASSGVLSGTPAAGTGGEYELEFSLTNSKGKSTKALALIINELPSLVAQTLPEATERTFYSAKLEASSAGYPAGVTSWTLALGSTLPAGLSLDVSSGLISGTPEKAGTYEFYVNAINAAGTSSNGKVSIKINEYTEAPTIVTSELPDGLTNSAYSATLQASGAPASFAWTVVGTLPQGLAFDASNGVLSGTPAAGTGGIYELEFSVSNSVGTASKKLELKVCEDLEITTKSLPDAKYGSTYSTTLSAVGYPNDFEWSVAKGSLPSGLLLNSTTGVLSGTPQEYGDFSFDIKVQSAASGDSATQTLSLSIKVDKKEIARLGGSTRYDTMDKIVQTAYEQDHTCDTILLATANGYADALCASALVGVYDAPIITTDSSNLLDQTARQIERLANGNTKVYVIGGNAVVGDNVLSQVRNISGVAEVSRICGETRIQTGMKIYEAGLGSWSSTCVVTNAFNFADALSIGSYCAANYAPIFGTSGGVLNSEQIEAIKAGGFSNVVVVGGDAGVDYNQLRSDLGSSMSYVLLAGATRIQTSEAVTLWSCGLDTTKAFMPSEPLTLDGICFASAQNYPDALVGVDLASSELSPVFLVNDSSDSQQSIQNVAGNNSSKIYHAWILGGTGAVSSQIESWIVSNVQ